MNTIFQSGQHPDADQLNAFAEHALPLHQHQETLAHLAICADCRAIVYLAQPDIPDASAPRHPIATPRPWYTGWMLAWPATVALAGLIFLTVHIYNAATARNQIAAVNNAKLEQVAAPPPPAPAPEPAVSSKPAPAPLHTPPAVAAPPPHASGTENTGATGVYGVAPRVSLGLAAPANSKVATAAKTPSDKKIVLGAVSTASFVSATPAPAPASPATPLAQTAPPPSAPIAGTAPRREFRSAASQYDVPHVEAQQAPPATSAANSGNSGIYGDSGQGSLHGSYLAGVPASSASAQVADSAATNATAVDAVSMDRATAIPETKRLPTLPSKLAALSVAGNNRHQLAVDAAGTLFRSEDAGVTWLPVPVQWTGRATKVELIPTPSARLFAKSIGSLTAPPPAAKDSTATAAEPPTFELTTDAGDHWISTDGKIWTHK